MLFTKTDTKEIEKESNTCSLMQEQIGHELFAERLYLSIAVWLDYKGYPETAKFFSEHAKEERGHAMDFINFILGRGKKAKIPETKEPQNDFVDAGEAIGLAVEQERLITSKIVAIYKSAIEEDNIIALDIIQCYIEEQVEEEKLFNSLFKLYKLEDEIGVDMEAQMHAFIKGNKHRIGNL